MVTLRGFQVVNRALGPHQPHCEQIKIGLLLQRHMLPVQHLAKASYAESLEEKLSYTKPPLEGNTDSQVVERTPPAPA